MKRIETVVWEPVPDKPNYVTKKGARKVREVFSELEAELKSAGLLPDEYFILDRDFADESMDCPEFCDVICYAQWGSNEGVYLEMDVVYLNEQDTTYVRKNFATGKTLAEDGKSYDRILQQTSFDILLTKILFSSIVMKPKLTAEPLLFSERV